MISTTTTQYISIMCNPQFELHVLWKALTKLPGTHGLAVTYVTLTCCKHIIMINESKATLVNVKVLVVP